MPIGIRPVNDFVFKKVFGTQANQSILISLLNAILDLKVPISEVTLLNPFNLQDFQDDKLSILDIRATDQVGRNYDVEIQVSHTSSLIERLVFYGCELYCGQMKSGDAYHKIKPVFIICILDGVLWPDSGQVHHGFQLTDRKNGRILEDTLAIHTLELGKYNLQEGDLAQAGLLDGWLFWLIHAQDYEERELNRLLPAEPIRRATQMIQKISELTEDKLMYDLREKAIRDRQWLLQSALEEGREMGREEGREEATKEAEIRYIHDLQDFLGKGKTPEADLRAKSLEQLALIKSTLWKEIAKRR